MKAASIGSAEAGFTVDDAVEAFGGVDAFGATAGTFDAVGAFERDSVSSGTPSFNCDA